MEILDLFASHPAPLRHLLRVAIRSLSLGPYRFRYRIGALHRMNYAYIIYQAAQLAAKLNQPRISVIEFGVAGGNGLLWMERHAEQIERLFPVKIDTYGFDTGGGLPAPRDYRDLAYHWQAGFFKMDREALSRKLKRSKVIFGDVEETCRDFFARGDVAPLGAVSHDLDFYSSTMSAFKLFEVDDAHLMPRVYCYFDDTVGTDVEIYSEFTGERLAIDDFNKDHDDRKIGVPFYLRAQSALGTWIDQIWVFHAFNNKHYNTFISSDNQQLRLAE